MVATLEDALEVVSRQGPVSVVTLEGETLRGALVEGGRGVKGLLAPRREVKEVAARQEEVETRLAGVRAAAAEAAALAAAAEAEARALAERIHTAEKDLVSVRHELQTADEERARLERKAGILDTERSQAEQERDAARLKLAEIAAGAHHGRGRADGRPAPARRARDDGRGRAGRRRGGAGAPRRGPQLARGHARAAGGSGERVPPARRRPRGARAAHRGGAARAAETAARRAELERELVEVERLLAEALLERDRVQGEAAVADDRVREARSEIEGCEQGLKERRRERDTLREALSEVDVDRARTGSDLDHLARECQQAIGQSAADAAASLGDEDQAKDVETLAAQVQEAREKLERMGAVNVLAVEQAQELDERDVFMTAQRQDLLDSIPSWTRPSARSTGPRASASRRPSRSSTSTSARPSASCSAAALPASRSSTRRTSSTAASTSWRSRRASGCRT